MPLYKIERNKLGQYATWDSAVPEFLHVFNRSGKHLEDKRIPFPEVSDVHEAAHMLEILLDWDAPKAIWEAIPTRRR